MGEARLSTVPAQGALAPGPLDPDGGDVLPLRRPGLWLPALLAMYALAGVVCMTAPWMAPWILDVFGAGAVADAAFARPLRIAGWVVLAGAAAAAALAWAWQRPRRIVFQAEGLWMPPFERASGSLWVPYRDVRAVHPWKAWRLRGRQQLVLSLRGRLPRFWSEGAFADPDGLERLAASVRAGVARLPDGAERLREIERRAASAAAAQRGWPVVSLSAVVVLTLMFLLEVGLRGLHLDGHLVVALRGGPEALAGDELYRLVTGDLLHQNAAGHLLPNLLAILLVGFLFERLVGGRRFLVVLLGSVLGSALASAALNDQGSIGASGAGYGAFACWIYVWVEYRDERPGNFYLPPWLVVLLMGWMGLVISIEVASPRIDDIGHAGGFVAGLALSAITIRGRPLAALARRPSRLATGLAVGLMVVHAGGITWGAIEVARELRADEHEALERAVQRLGHKPRSAVGRYFAAWQVATSPVATSEALRAARAASEQLVEERPEVPTVPTLRDTLATVYFRLGDAETASEIERRALREKPDAFTASQLARFEHARLSEIGPGRAKGGALQVVAGPEPRVRVEPPSQMTGMLDVYALAERPGGALRGLAWLTLRCGSGGADDCTVPAPDLPNDSSLVVAHVAPAPEGAEAPAWRFWPLDPEVAALPGPLPSEEASPASERSSP